MKKLILLIMTMLMLIFSAPLWAAGVLEEFESGYGGFSEGNGFSVSGGRLTFTGDGDKTTAFAEWNGGFNPGGWSPVPGNSNYFDDFAVNVDVTWLGGSEDSGYGLSVCNQENASGTADYVRFLIDGVGSNATYHISMVKNGVFQTVADWTLSDAIIPNNTNRLFIFKSGNYLVFSINDTEVEELEINGCFGGSVGVEVSNLANAAFDNFELLPFFFEYFSSGMGGFPSKDFFSVSDGQLIFRGDGSDGLQSLAWNGGSHPGGFLPNPGDSNYFENFNVSVDTLWQGGSDTGSYGLSVCNHKNSSGSLDYVIFVITGDGSYTVSTVINGVHERLVDWTNSRLINTKGSDFNELSITKKDNKFSFSINDTKVQELEIDGCVGGSIDLEASKIVNVAFDGFFLIDLPSTKKPEPPPPPGNLYLAFEGLQDFYRIGDKVRVDLVQKVQKNRFELLDLWVAVKLPRGEYLFFTDNPMSPYSPEPQPFKRSIDSIDESERLFPEFEISSGMGGDYIFYAVFVSEGKNPSTNGFAIKEIIEKKTTFAN